VSKKWRIVAVIAFVVAVSAVIVGFALPRPDGFSESILAGIAVSAFAFAVAILLIEGPVLTRERRLQKVISIATHSITQLNEQIAITLVTELGEYLASKLDSNINLDGEERDDWTALKRLLRLIFQDAKQVPVNGSPESGWVSEKDYLSYVEAARRFTEQVGSALGTDWEVQAQLLELLEYRNKLDARIREAGYPCSIRDEKTRFAGLAAIGDAIIDLIEGS